ncbi:hypothetical protein ACHAP5_009625 [Fusarium lateritium]
MPVTGKGSEYHVTRIPLPPGTQANLAILTVVTGKQRNWPPGLVKPPVLSKMSTTKVSGKLHIALNNMFKPGFFDKEQGKFIRASPNVKNYPGVPVNVYYKPDTTTVFAECRAITQMNSRSVAENKTLATGFFEWSNNFQAEQQLPGRATTSRQSNNFQAEQQLPGRATTSRQSNNFQAKPLQFSFTDRFPGLDRALHEDEFTGEVRTLVETLKAVPYDWAFVTGGPSGKTTTAMSFLGALAESEGSFRQAPDAKGGNGQGVPDALKKSCKEAEAGVAIEIETGDDEPAEVVHSAQDDKPAEVNEPATVFQPAEDDKPTGKYVSARSLKLFKHPKFR